MRYINLPFIYLLTYSLESQLIVIANTSQTCVLKHLGLHSAWSKSNRRCAGYQNVTLEDQEMLP